MTADESSVDRVHVVVPARDEEERVARCVAAIDAAAELAELRHGVRIDATLVLDRCVDRTRERALAVMNGRRWSLLELDVGRVGAARHAGVLAATASTPQSAERRTWIATTDADSVVTDSWLLDHLALARSHDVVVGRVVPSPGELSAAAAAEWARRHPDDAVHVHGANLGLRFSTYLRAGGFAAVSEHEDVLVVEAAVGSGARWAHGSLVVTSARPEGRTPGGFAGYVRTLEREVGAQLGALGEQCPRTRPPCGVHP